MTKRKDSFLKMSDKILDLEHEEELFDHDEKIVFFKKEKLHIYSINQQKDIRSFKISDKKEDDKEPEKETPPRIGGYDFHHKYMKYKKKYLSLKSDIYENFKRYLQVLDNNKIIFVEQTLQENSSIALTVFDNTFQVLQKSVILTKFEHEHAFIFQMGHLKEKKCLYASGASGMYLEVIEINYNQTPIILRTVPSDTETLNTISTLQTLYPTTIKSIMVNKDSNTLQIISKDSEQVSRFKCDLKYIKEFIIEYDKYDDSIVIAMRFLEQPWEYEPRGDKHYYRLEIWKKHPEKRIWGFHKLSRMIDLQTSENIQKIVCTRQRYIVMTDASPVNPKGNMAAFNKNDLFYDCLFAGYQPVFLDDYEDWFVDRLDFLKKVVCLEALSVDLLKIILLYV